MMSVHQSVCRLCCDTVLNNDVEVIDNDIRGMLQSVLTGIELAISENSVICNDCRQKLEANYNFKKQCIFTEDSITPFVAENVKINLKEIHNQIIQSEDVDTDKNICRLCLQFVDNDMTLSDIEKQQFEKLLPEIDLSRTNFVILCSTCYDLLYKYFVFVTSCEELEQQLCNYSLDQASNNVDMEEKPVSIKLEKFQEFIKNIKEEYEDDKDILNEIVDIKCDSKEEEEDDEQYDINNQDSDILKIDWHPCEQCDMKFKHRSDLKKHIIRHSDPSEITWYPCEQCDMKFKRKSDLKKHIIRHSDPSEITWYPCKECDKKFKTNSELQDHVLYRHTDFSQINWYPCEQCDMKFKKKSALNRHMLYKHTDHSEINWHRCKQCDQKFKSNFQLQRHVSCRHTDLSKIIWYQCEQCDRKFKDKGAFRRHIVCKHTDPSEITWYECEHCGKKCKRNSNLQRHLMFVHTSHSKINWYQCEQCDKKFKDKSNLKKHIIITHRFSCKTRWGHIRDNFRKSLKKTKTVSGQKVKTVKQYKYSQQLSFLGTLLENRETRANIDGITNQDFTGDENFNEEMDENNQNNTTEVDNLGTVESQTGTLTISSQHSTPIPRKNTKCPLPNAPLKTPPATVMEFLVKKQENMDSHSSQHPVDAFLSGIAPALKNLPPQYWHYAKAHIFAAIQKYEYKLLVDQHQFTEPIYTPYSETSSPIGRI